MRNSLFLKCKTSIGNNSGSVEDTAVKFAYIRGLRKWRIKRCDRRLNHVTGSDEARRFSVKLHSSSYSSSSSSSSSSSCVFFLSRRLTSQGVPNCPILCSSFQFTVFSQFCPILEIISPSSSWSSSCFDTTDFTFYN